MSNFKERNEHFARAMTDAQVSYIEAERAACDLEAENQKLHELLDFALPIAMYAASTEEGDRMRELMREVEV